MTDPIKNYAETLEQFEKLVERNETLTQLFKVAFELGYMRGYSHCNYQQVSTPNEAWLHSTFKEDLEETLANLSIGRALIDKAIEADK